MLFSVNYRRCCSSTFTASSYCDGKAPTFRKKITNHTKLKGRNPPFYDGDWQEQYIGQTSSSFDRYQLGDCSRIHRAHHFVLHVAARNYHFELRLAKERYLR